jgi:N-acetylmuramoyl-L-alanine amidase
MNLIKKPSPNFYEHGSYQVNMILLHYTGMKSAEEALDRLTDKKSKVSAHYTIDEDGAIYQHVAESKRAWHAGVSSWRGEKNINAQSIGIEIVNPGHEFGYKEFTPIQIDAVKNLCADIMKRHDIDYVLAHSDVAPDRKQDPGELFPWKELAQSGIGIWPDVSDEDVVKAAGIDIERALKDYGYGDFNLDDLIIAFQRHFVPEAFQANTQGQVCGLTKSRLYALLANHLISDK